MLCRKRNLVDGKPARQTDGQGKDVESTKVVMMIIPKRWNSADEAEKKGEGRGEGRF